MLERDKKKKNKIIATKIRKITNKNIDQIKQGNKIYHKTES